MKRFLQAILPLVLFVSCTDTSTPPTPPKTVTTTHMIRDVDFIADTYFLIDEPENPFSPAQLKTGVEVYRTIVPEDHIVDPAMRFPGWVIPDTVGDGQS